MTKQETGGSERIKLLIVDDEAGYVSVPAKRMARRGIDVTSALSGSAAIQTLRKQGFDVAVLDLKMEDMDGIEGRRQFFNREIDGA
jgi:CheY-like chemotaxis protein